MLLGARLRDSFPFLHGAIAAVSIPFGTSQMSALRTGQGPSAKVLNLSQLSVPVSGLPRSSSTATLLPQTRKFHLHRMQ
jgi:hypothetical protein